MLLLTQSTIEFRKFNTDNNIFKYAPYLNFSNPPNIYFYSIFSIQEFDSIMNCISFLFILLHSGTVLQFLFHDTDICKQGRYLVL